jgi:glycosyltransferase involved in cell wall biosynthesis
VTARPLTVAQFSNSLVRGGAEEHILTLLRGLDRQVFRPLLVCPPALARALGPGVPGDVEVVPLALRRWTDIRAIVSLVAVLRSRRVDVLHAHLFYASLFATPVARLAGVPVVLETPHVREHWRRGWLKGRFVVDRLIGRLVDAYVAVSAANARYLVEEKRLPAGKVVVIHNGCDLNRFAPDRPVPAGLRRGLGLGETDPLLIVVGRLEPQKGHRVLLDALPAIRERHPQARLVCVGDGSLRDGLEAVVRDRGLTDAVRFVGYRDDVADWLALADVVVLPSLWEGLPLAAVEALAAGRAVVATAVDGTPEVVVDGRTGLTVPPGDVESLAAAVCRLLGDPGLRHRLGQAGRAWVQERFGQDRQVRQTEALYRALWERRPRTVGTTRAIGGRQPAGVPR